MALDDMARDRGNWFLKQADLSKMLGCCPRRLREFADELKAAGYITTKRTGKSTMFCLTWAERQQGAAQDTPREAAGRHSERQRGATRSLRFLNTSSTYEYPGRSTVCRCGNYHDGEEPRRCGMCGTHHDPRTATEVLDPIEETRQLLAGYVKQAGLSWPEPDDEICVRTLNAAGGSLAVLYPRLRTLLNDRRLAPRESYAWFPTVIAAGSARRLA